MSRGQRDKAVACLQGVWIARAHKSVEPHRLKRPKLAPQTPRLIKQRDVIFRLAILLLEKTFPLVLIPDPIGPWLLPGHIIVVGQGPARAKIFRAAPGTRTRAVARLVVISERQVRRKERRFETAPP
jgi:hypothetical protein